MLAVRRDDLGASIAADATRRHKTHQPAQLGAVGAARRT